MNFEEFKERLSEDLKQALFEQTGENHTIETTTVNKLQNESYEAFTIRPEGSPIGVNLDVQSLYDAYSNGRSYDEVSSKASEIVREGFEHQPSFNISDFQNYDIMKEKLSIQVVATERNADMLKDIPHKEIEDMSLVCRFVVESSEFGTGTILVTNGMLDTFGITKDELFADAVKSAPEIKPTEIRGMLDIIAEAWGISVNELAGPMEAEMPIYVASTTDKTNGAGIIAYPGFMDMAAEKVGGEVVGLRWEDINLDEQTIDVNHALVYYPEEGAETTKSVMHVSTTKTEAGARIIPMTPRVKAAFVEEMERQKKTGRNTRVVDGMSGFFFSNRFRDVHNPQSINRTIKRIVSDHNLEEMKRAKREGRKPVILPYFSCHIFRHTFCTRLCEHESNLKVIQAIMGHADVETTMQVYAEISEMRKKEAFQTASEIDGIF